jgi:excisionase family DNA binding protein
VSAWQTQIPVPMPPDQHAAALLNQAWTLGELLEGGSATDLPGPNRPAKKGGLGVCAAEAVRTGPQPSRKEQDPMNTTMADRSASDELRLAGERLLTPGEVAVLFRVDAKTVGRWAAAGRIASIRTPGGHRRFRESQVLSLLTEGAGE